MQSIISWRDGVTLLLALGVGAFFLHGIGKVHIPFITKHKRIIILFIAIFGFLMFVIGGSPVHTSTIFLAVSSAIGILILGSLVIGIFVGGTVMLGVVTALVLLDWMIATLRHIVGS